jgi:hypothetical protein
MSKCKQGEYNNKKKEGEEWSDDEDIHIFLSGKYEFTVTDEVMKTMKDDGKLNKLWAYDDRKVKE